MAGDFMWYTFAPPTAHEQELREMLVECACSLSRGNTDQQALAKRAREMLDKGRT